MQVADAPEHRAKLRVRGGLDAARERLGDLALGMSPGGGEDVVLAVVEDLEEIAAGIDAALQSPGGARYDVLLAPAQQPELVVALAEVALALATGDEVVAEKIRGPGGAVHSPRTTRQRSVSCRTEHI